jgi:hypothetical protein
LIRRRGAGALLPILASLLLASCHPSKLLYVSPSGATPANSAALTGSSYSRNAFNDVYNCIDAIDGVTVGSGPFVCKHMSKETFLLLPGKHILTLANMMEGGQYTNGRSGKVTVDLAAGQLYTVRGDLPDGPTSDGESIVSLWLSDSHGAILGEKLSFKTKDPATEYEATWAKIHPTAAEAWPYINYPINNQVNPATLAEMRKLFIYADFGDRTQPFEQGFNARFRNLAAACGVEVKMVSLVHSGKLSLENTTLPPLDEMIRQAGAAGSDGLLRIIGRGWSAKHFAEGGSDRPYTDGGLGFEILLRPVPGIQEEWHPALQQVAVAKGGGAFAETLIQTLSRMGALPHCPPPEKPQDGAKAP